MSIKYSTFLSTLKECFEIRKLKDYGEVSSRSICLLRHDVDHNMSTALQIAQIEYSLDIQSTFFVLHDAKYYGGELFIKNCLKLQDMGHEVGLHNNIITVAIKTGDKPAVILRKELRYLRKNGVKIFGTSAHGDYACRKFGYVNYDIFKKCLSPYKRRPMVSPRKYVDRRPQLDTMILHALDLDAYPLYEAYFLPRDFYITDCRDTWRYIKGKSDEWHPDFQESSPRVDDILKFLREISRGGIILQALLHPNYTLIEVG